MIIPTYAPSLQEFMRLVALAVNDRINGYPFPQFDADPDTDTVRPGFTYYSTSTNKVRTFDGTAFNDLF